MKKQISLSLAVLLCLTMAAIPVLAAQDDYTYEDGASYQSGDILINSLGEGRAIYTVPFGDAWSVSFRVDLLGGNASDDPEANARWAILSEEFEVLGMATAKTMIGREAPDTRLVVQQLWNNNWSDLSVVEWTPHGGNSYNAVISKKAGENSLDFALTDLDGTAIIDASADFDAAAMAAAKHFGFYVHNSHVKYSDIRYTGFASSDDAPSPWAANDVENALALGMVPAQLQGDYRTDLFRVEFAALAVGLYELLAEAEIEARGSFDDTDDINVQKLAGLGIVSGDGKGNYIPDGVFSREMAITLMYNMMVQLGHEFEAADPDFADLDEISLWARPAVGALQNAGIVSGDGTNFHPQDFYTREMGIVTVMNFLNLLKPE